MAKKKKQQQGKSGDGKKVVASNRKARHEFSVVDTYEAGIVLTGSEVKSLREGQVVLKDAYAVVRDGEVWLHSMHIAPYAYARDGGHDPERRRKLLLHRREISKLVGRMNEQGLALIPLSVYFTHGLAKVELALAKGKRTIDKRETIKRRTQDREMQRAMRRRA